MNTNKFLTEPLDAVRWWIASCKEAKVLQCMPIHLAPRRTLWCYKEGFVFATQNAKRLFKIFPQLLRKRWFRVSRLLSEKSYLPICLLLWYKALAPLVNMAIPDFNATGVLPPHLGNPIHASQMSPYPATALETCEKYGFSPDRREILRGWLNFRELLRSLGHGSGFQWIDGSFLEDVERRRGLSPQDLDVVSFLPPSPPAIDPAILLVITNQSLTKANYKVHHIIVRLNWPGETIIEYTRFWCGLFSHSKDDGAWKGMLKVDLNTKLNDDAARQHLDSLGTP